LSKTSEVAKLALEISSSPVEATIAADALPASNNTPAIPNTVTAFNRLLRFEVCFACDMVEACHINSDGRAASQSNFANQPQDALKRYLKAKPARLTEDYRAIPLVLQALDAFGVTPDCLRPRLISGQARAS
jgi:hypothetical protein